MALEIKQSFRLSQQLVVTPQLQQAIKLLQLSRMELTNLVQRELEENPCLEEAENEEEEAKAAKDGETEESHGELHEKAKEEDAHHEHASDEVGTKEGALKEPNDFDWENYIGTYNTPEYGVGRAAASLDDLPTYENTLTKTESLAEHLFWQLGLLGYPEADQQVAIEILGNIDENGYLKSSLEEISQKVGQPPDRVEVMLKKIQTDFDPVGVGARTTKECLLLQCGKLEHPEIDLVRKMIAEHLEDLEVQNFRLVAKKMNLPLPKIMALGKFVHEELDPKPGRPYSEMQAQYITPDVFVHKVGKEYVVTLNEDGMPRLMLSPLYRRAIMKPEDVSGQEKDYIQDKLRAALWLIKSIHQRQRTLYRVTKSIVKFQRDFFDKGVVHLRPMVLKDVADDIGMHESTVSRVTTNKFAHTSRGLFELKYFFNSSVPQTNGGGGVASEAVKNHIEQLIHHEESTKPFSDQEIADWLKNKQNINIARRTVAKYREGLGVLPSSKRRRRM